MTNVLNPLGGTKNPFIITTAMNPVTGGVQIMITGEFSRRDQMKMNYASYLVDHLISTLDDMIEMWKKETA